MIYTVLIYNNKSQEWTTVIETEDEKEAVDLYRKLMKEKKNVIIDYGN